MTIVNLDKVLSGVNGNLESVVAFNAENALMKDYANGLFVDVKGLVKDSNSEWVGRQGEAKYGVLSTDGTGDVVMLHAPELQYDEKKFMRDFRNEAGKVVRGYRLTKGDTITVTDDVLGLSSHDGTTVKTVFIVKDGKLVQFQTAPEATKPAVGQLAFEVIADAGNELDTVEKAWTLQVI